MKSYKVHRKTGIKSWRVEERPREKLMERGISALTDAELIAILLGSGAENQTAVDLAKQILDKFGSVNNIAKRSIEELQSIHGIGPVKAISVVTAFELGRRKQQQVHKPKSFRTSNDVAHYLQPKFQDLSYEVFHVLYLSQSNAIKSEKTISKGGVSSTIIDVRIIVKEAINTLSSGIILCHNHPSGNLKPSAADKAITKKIQEAAKMFDVNVIDHIIVGTTGHFSFADNMLM